MNHREISKLVEGFVHNLEQMIRRAVVDQVVASVGTGTRGARGTRRLGGDDTVRGTRSGRGRSGGRLRRNPEMLGEMTDRFLGYLETNPNVRMEELAEALGASTPQLRLPLNKLRAEGRVKTEGQRRAMRYTIGSGTPSEGKASRSKGSTRGRGRKTKK